MDDEILAFYNRHPYPPPVDDLSDYRKRWQEGDRLRVDYHLMWPAKPYREDLDILVAGCGTSQAAKHAIRQPAARVTGIDISPTSLEHTRALKARYRLNNLHVQQLPIERVDELGRRYDKIICTGVLHHLADSDAGLRALREVLKPAGAMHLMVYAKYGRTGIDMLQEYCRRLGITPSEAEIKELTMVLKELPRGHPMDHLLRGSPDFQNPGALADALLNPRDRAYSVPELLETIERCGLTFGRWYRQAPYSPKCGILASTPHGPRLAKLPVQEQYTAVELFRGTISRHSLILQRDDQPGDPQPVRFDGEEWQNFVPFRHPGVICIQKNLPPGAAAVLVNQEHVDTDLIHPINPLEKHLFDKINGYKTIRKIIKTIPPSNPEIVREFFQRLWHYDHVVFFTSKGVRQ